MHMHTHSIISLNALNFHFISLPCEFQSQLESRPCDITHFHLFVHCSFHPRNFWLPCLYNLLFFFFLDSTIMTEGNACFLLCTCLLFPNFPGSPFFLVWFIFSSPPNVVCRLSNISYFSTLLPGWTRCFSSFWPFTTLFDHFCMNNIISPPAIWSRKSNWQRKIHPDHGSHGLTTTGLGVGGQRGF